jgi:hypothetical protein
VRVCRILVEKPESKKLLGRPRQRRENNIKYDFRDITEVGKHYIDLSQDRNQSCVRVGFW